MERVRPPVPDAGQRKSWWLWLFAIAGVALAARMCLVFWLPTAPVDDFWSYLARAENLYQKGVYGPFPDYPDASYPPAYPLLLAGALSFGGEPLLTAKIVNAGLAFLSVLLAGCLGKALGGPAVGLLAASLVAILPRGLLASQILASENLLQPVLFAFFLLAVSSSRRTHPWVRGTVAGLLLGIGTLTRVSTYALGGVWPLAARLTGRRRWARELTLLLLVQHVVLLPWALRNESTLGARLWLTSSGGINLFIGNHDGADGGWVFWRDSLSRVVPNLEAMNSVEIDSAARVAALTWIHRNPRRTLQLFVTKMHRLVFENERYLVFYSVDGKGGAPLPTIREVLPGEHFLKSHNRQLLLFLTGIYAATGVIAVFAIGIVLVTILLGRRSRRLPRPTILLLGTGAAYYLIVASVFFAATRFRWPAMDLLTIVTATVLNLRPERGAGDRINTLAAPTFASVGRSR